MDRAQDKLSRAAPHVSRRLTPFDRLVLAVAGGLLALIAGVVLLGDRVGVQVVRAEPQGSARSTSPVLIQFSESMDRASVEERLSISPSAAGAVEWSGTTLLFRPARPLESGAAYTVTLAAGARSLTGRRVLADTVLAFTVARPRVAYLAPADNAPQNIWIADTDGASATQVTFSPTGLFDFGVSPDGTQIAFAERLSLGGTSDIKVLDLATGAIRQVTNCVDADCTSPVWRPDGRVIAYDRVDYNTGPGSAGASPTRVWLIDLTTSPATTRPLFADLQILGYGAQWSADGQKLALFNRDQGILVYDMATGTAGAVPSMSGSSGALSPDGTRLVFPELAFSEGQEPRSYLKLADLEANAVATLTDPDEPIQDDRAAWRPGANALAIARRYQDERYTRGYQIVLLDLDTGEDRALTDDPRYANGFFSWDPTGRALVIQRLPELDEQGQPSSTGRPEIWVLDADSGAWSQVATNAFHPRWVP